MELMAEGRSNQAIADRMFVTLRAVEKHVTSIFTKLDLPASTDDHRRVLAVLAFIGDCRAGLSSRALRREQTEQPAEKVRSGLTLARFLHAETVRLPLPRDA